MLFNSYLFIFLFLPVTLIVYFLLLRFQKVSWAKSWLFVGSLFFYAYGNVKYTLLISVSILINYGVSHLLVKYKTLWVRKGLFYAALLFNVGLLCFYKYMDFFIENLNWALGSEIGLLKIVLPFLYGLQ